MDRIHRTHRQEESGNAHRKQTMHRALRSATRSAIVDILAEHPQGLSKKRIQLELLGKNIDANEKKLRMHVAFLVAAGIAKEQRKHG